MKIGFFTDTYFPQVSGVSTSIRTLKQELESRGHTVYIFTTTDPQVKELENRVIRMPSIPFVSFKERRVVVRGMLYAYYAAKELELDIVHTHTEFGVGLLGKFTAKALGIPCVHTYHTMYEDYLHYIAKGKIVRPSHVKQFSKFYTSHLSGIICPSQRVVDKLTEYNIERPMTIIPTGIDVGQFEPVPKNEIDQIKTQYDLNDSLVLLSVSRISYEKKIQVLLQGMPQVLEALPHAKLVIVGDGPFKESLEEMVQELSIIESVVFVGEIPNEEIAKFYQAADVFVSASDSETQGLTYTEAMAAKTKVVAKGNSYLNELFDDRSLGVTYENDLDFPVALIQYMADFPATNPDIISDKLYNISSKAFGEKVEIFYGETLDYYKSHPSDDSFEEKDSDEAGALKFFKK